VKTMQEVSQMAKEGVTLEEMLEEIGLTAKWEKRGEAKGVAIGEARGVAIGKKTGLEEAIKLLKQGHTVDELEQMVSDGCYPST
jgi:hypothetical protein